MVDMDVYSPHLNTWHAQQIVGIDKLDLGILHLQHIVEVVVALKSLSFALTVGRAMTSYLIR